jgi:hypothetical protein
VTDEEEKEYFEGWERTLEKNGYKSIIPVSDYFSRDMTEAWIMTEMWIREGLIVRIENETRS